MEFSLVGGLVAGLVGTAVMTVMMKMAGKMGMTDMPPMELVTGSMMSGDPDKAKQIGIVIHWIAMGTVGFGLGYALLFTAVDSASWLVGIGIGAAHGVVVGLVMAMMPAMHPRMGDQPVTGGSVDVSGGTVRLASPGLFGAGWGGMTPMGLLMGHVVYGLVVALVYQAFV